MEQFPFEYRAIPCRRIWFSTNKLKESVDLKIKHWKRREVFSSPLCENFRKSCKQRQVWLRHGVTGELRRMKSVSNLPE